MHLTELHAAIVHFPIALLPASLAADAAGLHQAGRAGMALAAGSGALAAASGLIAQEEAAVEGPAHDLLATHRTLNVGALGLTTALAAYRAGGRRPGVGYFAAGLVALGMVAYSAYLGGQMVYTHGVGVAKADGLAPDAAPPVRQMRPGQLLRRVGRDLSQGLRHAAEHLRAGDVAPALGGDGAGQPGA